ncbi:MAG: hypothetical protein QOD32_3409 [Pyrinomonadaceae bacterium]|jgi:hypothetical protein|nr:hypothetical protein [Pyrinomonadaceae bacterium]
MPTRKSSTPDYTSAKGVGEAKPAARKTRPASVKTSNTKRVLNVIPSRKTENDFMFDNASDAGLLGAAAAIPAAATAATATAAAPAAAPAIPASKDLRAAWWEINDQGSTGSCVGWATADSVIRWMLVNAGRLPKPELLAPRFIWMSAKETDQFNSQPTTFIEDEGTSLKAALDIARKYGNVPDAVLPFKTGKLYPDPAKTFYAIAAQYKIASYFNLGNNLANWRTWLATKGPILTRLNVDSTWYAATTTSGNLDTYDPHSAQGGHAVAIVGYTPSRFIVRNSWGKTWGDKGYAYASWSYASDAFTESYGVTL